MALRWENLAKDGGSGSKDGPAIGARILQVATIASAIHLMECADASCDKRVGEFRRAHEAAESTTVSSTERFAESRGFSRNRVNLQ